jgi:hypothetical protein
MRNLFHTAFAALGLSKAQTPAYTPRVPLTRPYRVDGSPEEGYSVVDANGSPVMHADEAEAAAEAANDIHELEVLLRYGIPFNPVPGDGRLPL